MASGDPFLQRQNEPSSNLFAAQGTPGNPPNLPMFGAWRFTNQPGDPDFTGTAVIRVTAGTPFGITTTGSKGTVALTNIAVHWLGAGALQKPRKTGGKRAFCAQ